MRATELIGRRRFFGRVFAAGLALITGLWPRALRAASGNFWDGDDYVGKTRGGVFERFYIQYYRSFRRVRAADWRLRVGGRCAEPQELTLAQLRALPPKTQRSRLKCVECWSATADWSGFAFAEIERLARPAPEAVGAVFRCADTYVEYLSLADLRHDRTLLVLSMDGMPLSDEHGFPLRLIVPFKYGYKSAKAILEIEFVDRPHNGTWSQIGPYSLDGTILPGYDHPLDRGGARRRISGGEVRD